MASEGARTVVGATALGAQTIVNALLGLVFFIFLARFISQAEMGVYASLLFAMGLFQNIGPLGLPVAAARFIPKSIGEGKIDEVSTYVTSIVSISMISALALALTFCLLSGPFSEILTKSNANIALFALASLAVFLNIPSVNLDALMQGFQNFGRLAIVRTFSQGLRVVVSVLLLVMGYGLVGVVIGFVAMNAVSLLFLLYFVRGHLVLRVDAKVMTRILGYSVPLLLSTVANFVSNQIDLLILILFTMPVLVGVYTVAVTISGLLGAIFFVTINATLQPAAAKVFGSSGTRGLESALLRASRYIAIVFVPAAIALGILGGTAINIMAGQSYLGALVPLSIISVASIAVALSITPTIALQTVGDTRSVLMLTMASILVGLAADMALIPGLAGTGAALGKCALMLAGLLAAVYLARKHLNLMFDLVALRKSLVASALMATVLLAAEAKLGFAPSYAVLYIPVGFLTFLVGMRVQHAFGVDDLNLILRVLPKRLNIVSKLIGWAAT